jgi:hypothetical protein
MSDYNSNPRDYDKYGNMLPGGGAPEPIDPNGRGPYVLLALLVAIGLVGGLLYFNGGAKRTDENLASAPAAHTTPAPSAMPAPATPPAALPPHNPVPNTTGPTNPTNPLDDRTK